MVSNDGCFFWDLKIVSIWEYYKMWETSGGFLKQGYSHSWPSGYPYFRKPSHISIGCFFNGILIKILSIWDFFNHWIYIYIYTYIHIYIYTYIYIYISIIICGMLLRFLGNLNLMLMGSYRSNHGMLMGFTRECPWDVKGIHKGILKDVSRMLIG